MTTAISLYGQSLYDLAAEEGLTEEILKQMEAVDEIFRALRTSSIHICSIIL